jgi:predicted ABC-type ATPase
VSAEKQLWVLAGGNGVGKTTFYRLFLEPRGIHLVNADRIAKEIDPDNPESVSYEAASYTEQLRQDLLSHEASFCFETVFSHESKIDFIAKAKALGYEIILVYIHLATPELNEARVQQRVSEGGHNVSHQKIHSRIPRTMKNIAETLLLVDEARLLDNSSKENPFKLVATVQKGLMKETVVPLLEWAATILSNVSYLHSSTDALDI